MARVACRPNPKVPHMFPDSLYRARDLHPELCSGTDASVESNTATRELAARAAMDFFKRVLKP